MILLKMKEEIQSGNIQPFSISTSVELYKRDKSVGLTIPQYDMETYVFNANDAKHYSNILSGGDIDKYVYSAQDGQGINFGSLFKAVIPLAKSIGRTVFGLAKPVAKAAGREAIKGMATAGLSSLANKTVDSVRRSKRKRSSTTSSRKKSRAL